MPPLRLTSLLRSVLPDVSRAADAVVSAVGCLNGHPRSAADLASWMGLESRFQLARLLRREGLPPLKELNDWARVLYWLQRSELTGASLRHLAARDQTDPAVAYRLVQRVLGTPWGEARRAGVRSALLSLQRRMGADHARAARQIRSSGGPFASLPRGEAQAWPSAQRRWSDVQGERLTVPGSPFDVATFGRTALVTRLHAAAVDIIDLESHTRRSVPTAPVPTRVVVGGTPGRAYVTHQFPREIGVLDLGAARNMASLPVSGDAMAAALTPNGRTLFITTNLDLLCAVSLISGRITAQVPVAQVCNQLGMHPSGAYVYVPTWKAGSIIEFDARTVQAKRTFSVRGVAQDVVVSSDNVLYATNEAGWLDVISLTSGRHLRTVQLSAPAFGLALSPDERSLLIGLASSGCVLVLDRQALAVRASLNVGGTPRRVAFGMNGRCAVVANEEGWVDILRFGPRREPVMTFGARKLAASSRSGVH